MDNVGESARRSKLLIVLKVDSNPLSGKCIDGGRRGNKTRYKESSRDNKVAKPFMNFSYAL